MRVENIYARKNKYGGIHIIATDYEFYPVGTNFDVVLGNSRATVEVKKVYIDDDVSPSKNARLTYQFVDNGNSSLSNGMDIREVLNCEMVPTPIPEPIEEEPVDGEDDENVDTNTDEV